MIDYGQLNRNASKAEDSGERSNKLHWPKPNGRLVGTAQPISSFTAEQRSACRHGESGSDLGRLGMIPEFLKRAESLGHRLAGHGRMPAALQR